ncbi:MAG: hypothetical protein M1831_002467 [Alyxoria varia]|nr:MAG: hypothetical protein M1831_002467 [Alyxoria varia]
METTYAQSSGQRRLRMQPLTPEQLPPHPTLSTAQSQQNVDLTKFAREVLEEALEFSDTVIASTFQKKGSPRPSPPSTANVQLLSSDLIKGESWCARQSVHENAPLDGTASYDELEGVLFHDHSEHEMGYTPGIFDAHKVLDWSEQLSAIAVEFGEPFDQVSMESKRLRIQQFSSRKTDRRPVYEMCHELPGPLNKRLFTTLVVRAKTRAQSFVVAQIPVDISNVSQALYANGRHRTDGDSEKTRDKMTFGIYTSIERVKDQDDGHMMWEMAVASDAGGFLPMPVQKVSIPGAVAKDVGLVMDYLAKRRQA